MVQNVLKIIAKNYILKKVEILLGKIQKQLSTDLLAFIERKIPVVGFYYNKVASLKGGLSARMT